MAANRGIPYYDNTRPLIFAVANMVQQLVQPRLQKEVKGSDSSVTFCPVILIDGPAGIGKSTFTQQLIQRLREIGVEPCFFEQDRFGVDRSRRDASLVNACTDLARDPATVSKLKEVMTGTPAYLPEYDRAEGKRYKNRVKLNPADVVIYEGVSCLSGVIYDNPEFNEDFRNAAPIKIFFTTDTDETLYRSRLKRDVEERGAHALDFQLQWDNFDRSNCLYTDRGKENANFIITRTAANDFNVEYVKPVVFSGRPLPSEYDTQLLNAEKQAKYHAALIRQRAEKLAAHREKWFRSHFVALSSALWCKDIDSKMRKELFFDFYLSMAANFSPHLTKLSDKPAPVYFLDDGILLSGRRASNPIWQFLEEKEKVLKGKKGELARSKDDEFIGIHKKTGFFAEKSLHHDKRFNNKAKLSVENSLAAVAFDHYETALAPVVTKVSASLLASFEPLVAKFVSNTASTEEQALVRFLIEPFLPESKDMELGKMPNISHKTPAEVAQWLVDSLKKPNQDALFTHMRFHIRFMNLVTSPGEKGVPLVPSSLMTKEQMEKLRNVKAKMKSEKVFGTAGGDRGRITVEQKKAGSLTSKFGTLANIEDVLPPFRKFIGTRSLPPHSAGVEYLRPITTTSHNVLAFERDIPLISSGSGAMAFLMCAADAAGLEGEELERYHLACLANLIGGGHHSLSECLAVSQYYLPFSNTGIQNLIPAGLQNIKSFNELIEMANVPEFRELWVRVSAEGKGDNKAHQKRL